MTIDSQAIPAGQKQSKQEPLPKDIDYSLRDQGIDRKVIVKGLVTIRVDISFYCEKCVNSSEYCQQCIMNHFKNDIDILGKYSIVDHALEVTSVDV